MPLNMKSISGSDYRRAVYLALALIIQLAIILTVGMLL
jgi:hypothetical protein